MGSRLVVPVIVALILVGSVWPAGLGQPMAAAATTNESYLISITAGNSTLVVGTLNQVQLLVKNTGSGLLANVVATVSAQPPLALFNSNGVFNIDTIDGYSYTVLSLQVYVPSSASAASLGSLPVTITFIAPDGSAQTAQQTVSFFLHNDPRLFQLQVVQVNDTATVGRISTISFLVQNTGEQTIFDPFFTLTLPQPLVVLGASQSVGSANYLSPGGSLVYNAKVSASPSASPGVYPGDLEVNYVDKDGIQHSQDFGVGLNLTSVAQVFQLRVFQVNDTIVSGQSTAVTFNVFNSGDREIFNPSFSLSVPAPLILTVGGNGMTATSVKPGESIEYTALVSSTPGLGLGVYQGELTITFDDQYGVAHVETFGVGLIVTTQTQIRFRALESSLTPGVTNNVGIAVNNTGPGGLSNIHFSADVPSTASVIGQLPEIPELPPGSGSFLSLQLFVPLSSAGMPFELILGAQYTDSTGHSQAISQSIGMFVNNAFFTSPIMLSLGPTTLQTGAKNNVTLTLTNDGNSTVQGLQVTVRFAGQYEWVGQNLIQVSSLGAGQSQVVNGVLYVPSAAPSSDQLQADMNYYYAGQQRTETREIGFLSRGIINLQLTSVTLLPQPAIPGQVESMTLTLTNLGTITASAVTATPQVPSGFSLFGSSAYFVGDMQVDTPTTFTLSVLVKNGTAQGTYQFPVRLSYLDNLRDQVSTTLNVPIQVGAASPFSPGTTTSSGRGGLSLLLPGVAIVAVALVVSFLWIRRRRRKAPGP